MGTTLPETNSSQAPENWCLEYVSFPGTSLAYLQGQMASFREDNISPFKGILSPMTFFRLVRYVTQCHSDEFQDDTLKTSKIVILPFKTSQKIPEDNTLRGYLKIPGHFEKQRTSIRPWSSWCFLFTRKNHPKRKERNHLRTHLLTVFNGEFKTRCCCFFSGLVTREELIGAQCRKKIGRQKSMSGGACS